MTSFLKLLLFLTLAACIILAGYKVYRYFNEKIISSRTLFGLIVYALLLIAACAGLFIGGIWGLLTIYNLLSDG